MIMRSSSFSRYFFDRIEANKPIGEAFEEAFDKLAVGHLSNPESTDRIQW